MIAFRSFCSRNWGYRYCVVMFTIVDATPSNDISVVGFKMYDTHDPSINS